MSTQEILDAPVQWLQTSVLQECFTFITLYSFNHVAKPPIPSLNRNCLVIMRFNAHIIQFIPASVPYDDMTVSESSLFWCHHHPGIKQTMVLQSVCKKDEETDQICTQTQDRIGFRTFFVVVCLAVNVPAEEVMFHQHILHSLFQWSLLVLLKKKRTGTTFTQRVKTTAERISAPLSTSDYKVIISC